jgi:hypothetical protein
VADDHDRHRHQSVVDPQKSYEKEDHRLISKNIAPHKIISRNAPIFTDFLRN